MNVHEVFYLRSVHWNHAVSDQRQASWIHSRQSCSDTEPVNFFSQEDVPLFCAMLRLDTVYVSHTVDPIQTRLCTAAAISPSPESLLKYFEGSLLPLFMHTFLKTAGSSFSSHFYDAHNSALPLHGCPFSFSSETITFSFTQFNYFHCSETRAWGLACLLLFIHRQSFSRWHA